MLNKNNISQYDPTLWKILEKETKRQQYYIELIASENYASKLVMEAQGSLLTNKYAEGYPKKRYYGGCRYVDKIEELAINRAKKLFFADYANVQPHSGSQANFAVYSALLKPGDTILGMNLLHGGHLTHGSPVNFSGKLYNAIHYGLDEDGKINYEEILQLTKKYRPKMIIAGFSAYSGMCNWKKIRVIADLVNAWFVVDMSHIAGLIAAKLYPSPLQYAHVVTTTTHKTLAGPRGGIILSNYGDDKLYKKLNSSVFPGTQGGPLMHVIAAKAIALKEAMSIEFIKYQKQIIKNAKIMSKIFIKKNFDIVSNGTHNHLFLLNLVNKNITGKKACQILEKAHITVNKNSVPNDPEKPFITSGIRIGTPAITRRGLKEKESSQLAYWVSDILDDIDNNEKVKDIKQKVIELCKLFPIYNIK